MRRIALLILLVCATVVAIPQRRAQPHTERAAHPAIDDAPIRDMPSLPFDVPESKDTTRPGQVNVKAKDEEPDIPEEEIVEEEIVEEEERGPDPVQRGDCSLVLYVIDRDTQRPVEADVQLWRLDAPGNEHWRRGDQKQESVEVPKDGRRIDDLPAGRYRIYSPDQRTKSEDPAEFEVTGLLTTVRLGLAMPRQFAVHVRVYTETGYLLLRGKRDDLGSGSSYSRSDAVPEWRKDRRTKDGAWVGCWSSSRGCGANRAPEYDVVATARGFLLGNYREDRRARSSTSSHKFWEAGRTAVSVFLTRDVPRDRTYVAVSVPEDPLLASIVLPDGRLASVAGARIRIRCKAKLEKPGDAPEAWRALPIQVRVVLKGFQRLEFVYRLGDRLPVRTLQAN